MRDLFKVASPRSTEAREPEWLWVLSSVALIAFALHSHQNQENCERAKNSSLESQTRVELSSALSIAHPEMSMACVTPVLSVARDAVARRRLVSSRATASRAATNAPCSSTESRTETTREMSSSDESDFSRRAVMRRATLALVSAACMQAARPALAAYAVPITDEQFASLEMRARTAYRSKNLEEAFALLTELHELEPNDGQWLERRGQVLVDLKRFKLAVADFNAAVALYEPEYKSLGLLSNRALAYEGLSEWR